MKGPTLVGPGHPHGSAAWKCSRSAGLRDGSVSQSCLQTLARRDGGVESVSGLVWMQADLLEAPEVPRDRVVEQLDLLVQLLCAVEVLPAGVAPLRPNSATRPLGRAPPTRLLLRTAEWPPAPVPRACRRGRRTPVPGCGRFCEPAGGVEPLRQRLLHGVNITVESIRRGHAGVLEAAEGEVELWLNYRLDLDRFALCGRSSNSPRAIASSSWSCTHCRSFRSPTGPHRVVVACVAILSTKPLWIVKSITKSSGRITRRVAPDARQQHDAAGWLQRSESRVRSRARRNVAIAPAGLQRRPPGPQPTARRFRFLRRDRLFGRSEDEPVSEPNQRAQRHQPMPPPTTRFQKSARPAPRRRRRAG